MIVTHTSLECFKSCRKKYDLRYKQGIVPKIKSEALEFGTAWHTMLEQYFKQIEAVQAVGANFGTEDEVAERSYAVADTLGLSRIDTAKLMGLTVGYIGKWYEYDIMQFDVIDVEKEFSVPILDDRATFVGKVDGLVQQKSDGKYYIVEHKTASNVDDNYVAQKDIDTQTMIYAMCLEDLMGIQIHGVIHDIAIKQKIRQKKGESEEEFCDRLFEDVTEDNFKRIVVEINRDVLDEFKVERDCSVNDLLQCDMFYKCTNNCVGKYGACEYLPICRAGGLVDSLRDKYETRRQHEEISPETANETEE